MNTTNTKWRLLKYYNDLHCEMFTVSSLEYSDQNLQYVTIKVKRDKKN